MLISILGSQDKMEHSSKKDFERQDYTKQKAKKQEQRALADPMSPLHKHKYRERGYGANYCIKERQKYWKIEKP